MEEDDGVMVEESDEDIYGDLETDIFFPPTKKAKQTEGVPNEEYEKALNEIQILRTKLKDKCTENKTLRTNMSSLFLTAKNEIEKKNFIMKSLQEKLKTLTKSKSPLSKEAAEEIITKCQEALQDTQAQLTLDEIKKSLDKASILKDSKRKHIKFGNMSVYFFREQGCFQRQEEVEFPKKTETNSSTPSHVPHHNDLRIKPSKESAETAESNIPGGRPNRNSESNKSGSTERYGGTTDKDSSRRKSTDQENSRMDDDRPPVPVNYKRGDSSQNLRPNREYSPSTEKHYNSRSSRGGARGKGDYKYRESHRNSDYRPRPSTKRFSNDTRYSNKRHRTRSRSR
ncbi:unnamed protein product [Orchesella dallaii]|uniref:Uncharacterized protein n=1 Tax=Orchesella dallaii TaxID=48710 RepID=A0ABP1Q8N4_9HEXA